MAAAYMAGIARNHPGVDGNKQTAFVVGVLFLEINGYRFTASEEDATQAVLGLAEGTLDEASFSRWLRAKRESLFAVRNRSSSGRKTLRTGAREESADF